MGRPGGDRGGPALGDPHRVTAQLQEVAERTVQKATELLGKAYAWRNGPATPTHDFLVAVLSSLKFSSEAQNQLGYKGQNANWKHLLRKGATLAKAVESLAPALAGGGPNPEYPWPTNDPTTTPFEFVFPIWNELAEQAHGRQFLKSIADLFATGEAYL